MMQMRGAMTVLILFAGGTAIGQSAHHRAPPESISFEVSSWGYPIEGFRIASNGVGEYRKAPAFRAAVQVHRFNAGPAGFARIRAALAGIERYTTHAPACGSRATDLPYGQIVWRTQATNGAVAFDLGCQDAEMQRVVTAAHDAARIAERLSQANRVR